MQKCPAHPRADKDGYVREHVLVIERAAGRILEYFGKNKAENEIVHHKNQDRSDNRIENLSLMRSSDHVRLHKKIEALRRRSSGFKRAVPPARNITRNPRPNIFRSSPKCAVQSSVADEFSLILSAR